MVGRSGKELFLNAFFNNTGKIYPLPDNDSVYHVTYPVAQFDHDEGVAISGGFEYRGTAIPQLTGKYLFGDIASGKLFFVNMKDLKLGNKPSSKNGEFHLRACQQHWPSFAEIAVLK